MVHFEFSRSSPLCDRGPSSISIVADLEDRIMEMIVSETGIDAPGVQLNSKLAEDIGMDGDDAEDFFRKFSEDLNVDLAALYENWDRHFIPRPRGHPLGASSQWASARLRASSFTKWRIGFRLGCRCLA